MNRNPYEVFGISENATEEDLKNAYRYLARKFEEDKNAGPPLSDIASKKLDELNQAYDEIIRMRANNTSYSYGNNSSYEGYDATHPYTKAYRLLDEQKYYEAESLLESIPEHMRDAEWYYLRGRTYYYMGWYDSAENAYKTAYKKDRYNPKYKEAHENMNSSRDIPYKQSGGSSSCDACDICSTLICADCCCECMGGDLIPCC